MCGFLFVNFFVKFVLASCTGNVHRIITGEAAFAVAEAFINKFTEALDRQICKAVCVYIS